MKLYYILKGTRVVPVDDAIAWGEWYEKAHKDKSVIVKQETVGKYFVSTVFLGIDHGWALGKPVLFESMIFLTKKSGSYCDQVRYHTYGQALRGHKKLVEACRKGKYDTKPA